MMGSSLQVKSQLGQGSCFWMTLSLPEASNLVKSHQLKKMSQYILGYKGEYQYVLLVIDDKKENRMVLQNLLSPLGFRIIEATDGQEGLEMAQSQSPDLIMTDLVMPRLDGFELSRRLRLLPEFQTTPIIAVSASVFDYHQEQSLAAGCTAFIPKPVHADSLFAHLQAYLHLEWTYGNSHPEIDEASETTDSATSEAGNNWTLTSEQASHLYDLAMQGDTMGLFEYAETLAQMDSHLAHFAEQVKTLADNFEDDQVLELVKPFMDT